MAVCPICRRNAVAPEYKPFCSQRCADNDLQGWLSGRYVVAGEETLSREVPSDDDED